MLNSTPVDRTYSWIKRECTVAEELYRKMMEEAKDPDWKEIIPTPEEYIHNAGEYKTWWDAYKEDECNIFRQKHAATLAELEREKEEAFYKLTLSEEQKLQYIIDKLEKNEKPYEVPEEYTEDLKQLRGFFNCDLAVYMGMLSLLFDLLASDEFGFIKLRFIGANNTDTLPNLLINDIAPFENYYFLEQHTSKCKGCSDCVKESMEELKARLIEESEKIN